MKTDYCSITKHYISQNRKYLQPIIMYDGYSCTMVFN